MPAQPQQAHDRSTPESLIRSFYAAVSGPSDVERDWDAIRTLFHPSARIVITQAQPDGTPIGAFELEPFFEHAAAVYRAAGFWEREVWARIDRFAAGRARPTTPPLRSTEPPGTQKTRCRPITRCRPRTRSRRTVRCRLT